MVRISESLLDHCSAAVVLVAHQVPVGVPGLHCGLVAEQRLKHLDGLSGADLDRGEVVMQVVWGGVCADLSRRLCQAAWIVLVVSGAPLSVVKIRPDSWWL